MQTILLVEDDSEITRTLEDFLRSEGFAVTAADGQSAALDCMARGRFDLVLLDISLRDGNGYAVCNELKKRKNPPPVIFLTASATFFRFALLSRRCSSSAARKNILCSLRAPEASSAE